MPAVITRASFQRFRSSSILEALVSKTKLTHTLFPSADILSGAPVFDMNSQQQRILPLLQYRFFLRRDNRFFFAAISILSSRRYRFFLRRDIDFSSPRYQFFLRGDIDFFFAPRQKSIFLRLHFARLRCLCPSWLRPLIASREIKNNSLACDVNALVAATANGEMEN
jgi:hypothetical protein